MPPTAGIGHLYTRMIHLHDNEDQVLDYIKLTEQSK